MLTAARHIYERAGFRLMETNKHNEFGRTLVGETWKLELEPHQSAVSVNQTVAPFALARRKCSSRRGMISTKLQGR